MACTPHPRLLVLETSGRIGRIALAHGPDLGPVVTLDETRRHARDLAPAVVELLGIRGWRARDLDGVAVSRGPGSYTGLRVGLMSAKTLAYATGCTLLAVDTFASTARSTPAEAVRFDVVADAQQQFIYVQRWVRHSGRLTPETDVHIQSSADWLQELAEDVWVTGPGTSLVEGRLRPEQPRVDPDSRESRPGCVLEIALERWAAGESDDIWTVEPLYLRPSNAETNWAKQGK